MTRRVLLSSALLLLCSGWVSASGPAREFARPDARLTPGAVRTTDRHLVCASGASRAARNVSSVISRRVYAAYHRTKIPGVCCEVDHLVSLELGGSNDMKNLWPQPWAEARVKDTLENRAHALVCAGTLPLADAQRQIRTDWVAFYRVVFGRAPVADAGAG